MLTIIGYLTLIFIVIIACYGVAKSIFILRFRKKDGYQKEISKLMSSTIAMMVVLGAIAFYAFNYS